MADQPALRVTFPVWAVADRVPTADRGDPVRWAGGEQDGEPFVALFFDNNVARRFADAAGFGDGANHVLKQARTPHEYLELLEHLGAFSGARQVGFVHDLGKPAALVPIQLAILDCRRTGEQEQP